MPTPLQSAAPLPRQMDLHRAELEQVIHMARGIKTPTVSTVQAGKMLGCKRSKMTELIKSGLIAGFRLPRTPTRKKVKGVQRRLGLNGESAEAPSGDMRHHRIPTICVLLTILRERLPGWETCLSSGAALHLLGSVLPHLTLPMLRDLEKATQHLIATRTEALKQAAGAAPKRGEDRESTPDMFN